MNINRRGFLKGVSCTAAPLLLPGCTALTFSSNEKIRVAVIGLGRIASSFEIPGVLARTDIARIVAVCDLDSRRLDFAKGNIEKFYREKGFAGYTVDTYSDYKEVCARKDVDAVMLCLPDFWHALVSTTAICAGKAVWLQKPFTQTIEEGRLLANLAKRYNTVMQVDSQQRSWNQFQGVCEAVQKGEIGRAHV